MNQRSAASELLLRLLLVSVVGLSVWGAFFYLNDTAGGEWRSSLKKVSSQMSSTAGAWFSKKVSLVEKLAEDPRVKAGFEGSDLGLQTLRKAIYEFKYLNEKEHGVGFVYIFDNNEGRELVKSSGAPDMPSGTRNVFSVAAGQSRDVLVTTALLAGKPSLLFGKVIRTVHGAIYGYAIYSFEIENLAEKMGASWDMSNVETHLYELAPDGRVHQVRDLKNLLSYRNRREIAYPTFYVSEDVQTFEKFGQEFVGAYHALPSFPTWFSFVSAADGVVYGGYRTLKILILSFGAFLSVFFLILPYGGGRYSQSLRQSLGGVSLQGVKNLLKFKKKDTGHRRRASDRVQPSGLGGSLAPSVPSGDIVEALKKRRSEEAKKHTSGKPKPYTASESVVSYNIRTGIKNKRIRLLYQPVFDSKTGQPIMFEVFLRIIDEVGEVLSPAVWLPVAKKENLFSLIDEEVVHTAIQANFMKPDPLKIPLAFNISGNTFESLTFMEKLMNNSVGEDSIAKSTIFELRSRELIEDKKAMSFIRECREMGFRFSVDYFGGGTKALEASKALRFDFVKIDCLRFDMTSKDQQKEMIRLIKTAESLKLPVVMEKVENERVLNFCQKVGAPFVQGYHLAEPKSLVNTNKTVKIGD